MAARVCPICGNDYSQKTVERVFGKESSPALLGFCSAICYTQSLTMSANTVLSDREKAMKWGAVQPDKAEIRSDYHQGTAISDLTDAQIEYMWRKETQQLSDQEKANIWWNDLKPYLRVSLLQKHDLLLKGGKAEERVLTIWRKETSPTTTVKEGEDKLESIDFFDLMQNYRIADISDQENVINRFNSVKKWIKENFVPKPQ